MTAIPRPAPPKALLGRAVRYIFLACTCAAGAMLIVSQRGEIAAALAQASIAPLLLAQLLCIGHVAMAFVAWRALLVGQRVRPEFRATARMFFLGQIGKYAPGGIWSFVGVAEFGRSAGFDRRMTIASQFLAMLLCIGVGAAIGLAAVPATVGLFSGKTPALGALPLLLTLPMLHPGIRAAIFRFLRIDFNPPPRSLLASAAMMAVLWVLAGAQIVVLTQAVGAELAWSDLPAATGIYAISWVAGFLFVVAPAGIGAREAILVALLSAHMPLPQALTVSLLSRVGMTLADFLMAALAGLLTRPQAAR